MTDLPSRYRTGDDDIDAALAELTTALPDERDRRLVFETMVSAVRLGLEGADRGELKLVNTSLKELRYSFKIFDRYADKRKVSIFGSARTRSHEAAYRSAHDFARAMVNRGWMVITGAGPGIMTAGIEGAGRENSFGVNIMLPFESGAPEALAGDEKLINFRYFFTRKLTFMKESHGYCMLPGGFGTMDEAFELLTLMQTGRTNLAPVVLLEPDGGTYWQTWADFVRAELEASNLISGADLGLVHIASNIDEAADHVTRFYRVYHSMRFVGRRLILRLEHPIDDEALAELNREFADILEDGAIERTEVTESELDDDDVIELPRLAVPFDRAGYGRLRQLIDRVNAAS